MEKSKENTSNSSESTIWAMLPIFLQVIITIAAPELPDKIKNIFLLIAGVLFALALVFIKLKKTRAVTMITIIGCGLVFISCFAPFAQDEEIPTETAVSERETLPEENRIIKDENPAPEETKPADLATEATAQESEIEIDFEILLYSCNGIYVQLTALGETGGEAVNWYSSDSNVAAVDSNGLVTARAAGQVVITAEVYSNGKNYKEEKRISVYEDFTITETGKIRYFESLPQGIDTSHPNYLTLEENYQIFESELEALNYHKVAEDNCRKTAPKVIGYVFYHWCRGDDVQVGDTNEDDYPYDEGSFHNRLSESRRCEETVNGGLVQFDTFSCFFSNKYLSESEMLFATDGSGCAWYSGSGVCYDSYWFWPIPIYEYVYELTETELIAKVD